MTSLRKKLPISEFLELARRHRVIDVRSPSEFLTGHIPGAVNIPLFDDNERAEVGIKYRNEGRIKAIIRGIELSGPKMSAKLSEALSVAKENKLLVHCWRGGMRSEAMAWLFSLADIETEILEGGYKSYRQHVLEYLRQKRRYIVLGGLTGSGKTELLHKIRSLGEPMIDLEGIACHKGSAFGSLGQPPQPSSEHFANILYTELVKTNPGEYVWLEDESRNIGTVFMPDQFYFNMQKSPVIALIMDVKTRIPRLLKEYSNHSSEELLASVKRISKRLGGDNTRESLKSIESGDFKKAIEITLKYYDKAYMYGLKRRPEANIRYVETDTDDVSENVKRVLETAANIREGWHIP